jgi:hypothetical protein
MFVVAVAYLVSVRRGNSPIVYQDVGSEDGRCLCSIMEYDDPKDDVGRILDLQIALDGAPALSRSHFGNKRWPGTEVRFAVTKTGPYYFLSIVEVVGYSIAAVDGGNGVVWCNSSNASNEYLYRVFETDPEMPELTDLNSLIALKWIAREER